MAPVTRQTKRKTSSLRNEENAVKIVVQPQFDFLQSHLNDLTNTTPSEINSEIKSGHLSLPNIEMEAPSDKPNHPEDPPMRHDFSFLEVALNLNNELAPPKPEYHQCNLCRYYCKDEMDLKRHAKYHLKDKLLKCHICPFFSKSNSELEKHFVKEHIVKKKYACPNCDYSTPRCDKLNRHLLIHSGEKPFKCHLCPYSGRDRDKLKRHSMIHTGEKPAKCPLCSYCGRDNDKVKRHLATHVRRIKE